MKRRGKRTRSSCEENCAVERKRIRHAEARVSQAETRIEQAKTRIEQAETRTEQAETRTERAKTRAEQAEIRAEQAENILRDVLPKEILLKPASARLLSD